MAKRTNRRPSEIVGIDCDWCAWCFDDALLYRELAELKIKQDEDEAQKERDTHRRRARQAAGIR
jgi:hypothetical protein